MDHGMGIQLQLLETLRMVIKHIILEEMVEVIPLEITGILYMRLHRKHWRL